MSTAQEGRAVGPRTAGAPGSLEVDTTLLRPSAGLLLCGQLLYVLVTQFHAGGEANDHRTIFETYAHDDSWKVVHVAQFLAMALIVGGLLVLGIAFRAAVGRTAWVARLGAAAAVVALTLFGVLQALDGVGNKEVDRAWDNAPEAEEAARFASAESVRWLEWGVRSYHDYALGFALLLFAAAVLARTEIPRVIGWLMAASGVVYLAQGWVVGAEGFSGTHTVLIVFVWVLSLAWMSCLLAASRRHTQDVHRVVG